MLEVKVRIVTMGSGLGHSLEAQAEALGDSDRQDAGALGSSVRKPGVG